MSGGDVSPLVEVAERLGEVVGRLIFRAPVTHVYNPVDYAWAPHRAYVERFGRTKGRTLLLGMNPGPFGMAQTGVPFGDVGMVRDWMGIEHPVGRPPDPHPKRPVEGFACSRREVSGRRLWGWAAGRFGTPAAFFARFFVWNYCPLAFMEASGRNRTPDKLPAAERDPLYTACDEALRHLVDLVQPDRVVGIGRFAEARSRAALGDDRMPIASILHPSPASPAANRDWVGTIERQLGELGVEMTATSSRPAAG